MGNRGFGSEGLKMVKDASAQVTEGLTLTDVSFCQKQQTSSTERTCHPPFGWS